MITLSQHRAAYSRCHFPFPSLHQEPLRHCMMRFQSMHVLECHVAIQTHMSIIETEGECSHSAPMQVSALSILETLREGLRMGAQSPKIYMMALTGLRLAIRMSCAAGHHTFTDDAISMLCTATGVYSPAPPGSPHEARQLQARLPAQRCPKNQVEDFNCSAAHFPSVHFGNVVQFTSHGIHDVAVHVRWWIPC
jgi:hypothetical protein